MKRAVRVFAGIAVTVLCLSLIGYGQTTNATIMGRVLDPSKAAVVGADVQATNVDNGTTYKSATNGTGLFSIPGVAPGNYRISVTKPGFRSIVKPDVVLHLQEVVALNFDLPIGSASEVITVTAGASMVNTTDGSVSTVVDQSYVKNMPLNGRSFQDLILLTPGIVTNSPQNSSFVGQKGEFSVNGQRTESNNYTVDGVSANVGATADQNAGFYGITDGAGASGSVPGATALGTTQALVSVDDLQEFRIQSSTYSAEYGRYPGGQFAFETKSGTNQLHGTAYDYLRNDIFDATDYFTNYLRAVDPTLRKTAVRQNDFGGTIGGPLRIPHLYNGKDKTFFFVSYEGLRLIQPQPAATSFVPDLCMRGTGSCPSYVDSAGNTVQRIPAASALLPFVNSFPVPSANGIQDPTNGVSQFVGTWSNPNAIDSTSVRFDHTINDKFRLFFRFSDTASDSTNRGLAIAFIPPTNVFTNAFTMRTYTAGVNSLFNSRMSNELRFNYSSNESTGSESIGAFGGSTPIDLAQLAGIGSAPRPAVAILFVLGSAFVQQPQGETAGAQRQWNLTDTLRVALGSHRFSFGTDYRRLSPFALPSNPSTFYIYSSESDIEANNSFGLASAYAPAYPLYSNYSLFAEDEWKVSNRLNLSLGLRWDVNPPPGVTQGLKPYTIAFLGTDPNNWRIAPQGTPLWKTTWFNFGPRLGIAYSIRDKQGWETVLHGGGGLFFDTGQQLGSLSFDGVGFQATIFAPSLIPFPGNLAAQIPAIPNPSGPGPFFGVTGFYPNLQLPYTLQWNVSLEQALGSSQAITTSYVGSHAGRLLQTNQFSSTLSLGNPASVVQNGLTSDFDSLQLQFRRRLSHGLTTLASYTWSHCLDYGSSNIRIGYRRGNCDFDVRHNFSAGFSYDVPSVGNNPLVNVVLHHWGVDDRITVRTAFPVTLVGNALPQPNGKVYDGGLSFVPNEPVYLYGANCAHVLGPVSQGGLGDLPAGVGCPGGRAINPNAFMPVAAGYGNTPRNFARGFGAWQMNMAIRREFPLTERAKLQFRAEAFNIFNHPNFGNIDPSCFGAPGIAGCTNPTFGQATATLANSLGVLNGLYQMGGSRSMQFALKLVF